MTTNVFIVDDSATARTALRLILETSDDINVIGVASNPLIALKRMSADWPDVIISDIEMPEMDGFEFLKYLRRNRPTPFIVFSNHTGSSAARSVEALSKGAVDIIPKPNFNCADSLEETSGNVLNAVRAAAILDLPKPELEVEKIKELPQRRASDRRRIPDDEDFEKVEFKRKNFQLIAIGSSTGGTTIIEKILRQLPVNSPGILIVQHMPELFTHAFAKRINQFCKIEVKEAEDGDEIRQGLALIAPGGKHMKVTGRNPKYSVKIFDGEYVNRHKPSVDVLFNSVSETIKKESLGIILTGMGKDGAKGLLNMRNAGALAIAQESRDCAVYGMPKAAKALNAIDQELTSNQIAWAASRLQAST